jgi:hypothetical protein
MSLILQKSKNIRETENGEKGQRMKEETENKKGRKLQEKYK